MDRHNTLHQAHQQLAKAGEALGKAALLGYHAALIKGTSILNNAIKEVETELAKNKPAAKPTPAAKTAAPVKNAAPAAKTAPVAAAPKATPAAKPVVIVKAAPAKAAPAKAAPKPAPKAAAPVTPVVKAVASAPAKPVAKTEAKAVVTTPNAFANALKAVTSSVKPGNAPAKTAAKLETPKSL